MTWLIARIRCRWRGHDWRLLTADLRYSACHDCGKQKDNGIPYDLGEWRKVLAS